MKSPTSCGISCAITAAVASTPARQSTRNAAAITMRREVVEASPTRIGMPPRPPRGHRGRGGGGARRPRGDGCGGSAPASPAGRSRGCRPAAPAQSLRLDAGSRASGTRRVKATVSNSPAETHTSRSTSALRKRKLSQAASVIEATAWRTLAMTIQPSVLMGGNAGEAQASRAVKHRPARKTTRAARLFLRRSERQPTPCVLNQASMRFQPSSAAACGSSAGSRRGTRAACPDTG